MKYNVFFTALLCLCVGILPCSAQENSFDFKGAFQKMQAAYKAENTAGTQENKAPDEKSIKESSANTFIKPMIKGSIIKDLEETGLAVIHLEFEAGKAEVLSAHLPMIEEIYTGLMAHPEWKLRIEGYTDNTGKASWNKKLSLKRAEAIQQVLIEKNIAKERLTCVGLGSENPINPENTEEARQQNRRVEFHVE